MMKAKKLLSIKTRILVANISFVMLAFLGIIVIFNVLMDHYISNTATNQLARVVNYQSGVEQSTTITSSAPDLNNAPRGSFNIHPVAFIVNRHYQVQTLVGLATQDKKTSQEIAEVLKSKKVSLSDLKNYRLEADNSTFYLEASKQKDGYYLLQYVDITGIVNFSHSVNLFLVLVALAIVIILGFAVTFVTEQLIRPISRLSRFATQIGKGDFTPCDDEFKDLELSNLADTMNAAAAQLARNDQDQKTFFQNASHELRTPLMTIKSYAEGISYEVIPVKKASKVILAETDRMSELVEDLLTLSRIDTIKQQEVAPYSLQDLLNDVANEQEVLINQKNLKLVKNFSKNPVILMINYKNLRRAVINLVSNALRYAHSEIILTCKQEKGKIILSVSNDGPMIAETEISHLFERFYKGNGGVHGIGLAIVKAIVEQNQGKIQVKSSEKLTQFILTFEKRTN